MRLPSTLVRLSVLTSALTLGCSPRPSAEGVLRVTITLSPGATSRCVILKATPARGTVRSTDAMPFHGQTQLEAGVYQGDMGPQVTLTATGFGDDGCTTATVPAETGLTSAVFVPGEITDVAITLGGAAQGDGGSDGGADAGADGGTDGGPDGGPPDAGPDLDGDGYPASVDCDDNNPSVHPDAGEKCFDGIDNDCNTLVDCADPACAAKSCMADAGTAAMCSANVCKEMDCADGIDNDRDTLTDCADPDCNLQACANQGLCQTGSCDAGVESGALCSDGIDNNHNGLIDCQESTCNGASCNPDPCFPNDLCSGGACVPGAPKACTTPPPDAQCHQASGTCGAAGACSYAVLDGGCNDALACTVVDTCRSDGTCSGTQKTCTSPPFDPQCLAATPSCNEADGGSCDYVVNASNACTDGLACTTLDHCTAGGTCVGTNTCTSPPGSCFDATGTCGAGGCSYTVNLANTCSDFNNCSTGDHCLADGGCLATSTTTCAGTECKPEPGTCNTVPGSCDFTLTAAGTLCNNDAGTCDGTAGLCVPIDAGTPDAGPPAFTFPYTVSNVDWTALAAYVDGGNRFVPPCNNTTINTSGATPTLTATGGGSCDAGPTLPPFTIVTQPSGPDAVVFVVNEFTLNATRNLHFTGTRPAIWVVFGDAGIAGTITADAGVDSTWCGTGSDGTRVSNVSGGGGGGAFGPDAGTGGNGQGSGVGGTAGAPNGVASLSPLRGGCSGGVGANPGGGAGGVGGGAIQISASNRLDISGTLTTPGQGGQAGQGGVGTSNTGGGGGGSGGAILLEAATTTFTAAARVAANGGSGGEGRGTIGNNGSAGTTNTTGATTTNFGNCGGLGGGGGARASVPTNGGNGNPGGAGFCAGAGGAGGAVGRVRINTAACSGTPAAVSPAPTNGTAACP